jgi:RNA polymerase sigma-70 factor (family 1)
VASLHVRILVFCFSLRQAQSIQFLAAINQIFKQIFASEYSRLCRYALSYVQDEQTAEDVVQETFVKIWETKKEILTQPHIRFYLVTAVRNNCISLLRKQKSSNERYAEELPEPDPEPFFTRTEQVQQLDEQKKRILDALNRLPPKCKEVFMLVKMQELTYQQAADSLDISVKTVENHMGKALKILRESLSVATALLAGFFVVKQLGLLGVLFLQRVLN